VLIPFRFISPSLVEPRSLASSDTRLFHYPSPTVGTMHFYHSLAALSVATSFVFARPLPHYRRQAITNFGTCNATPDIIFALGLDGRKDPSFQAKNNNVYNRESRCSGVYACEYADLV
jgi:hypothetical protein